MHDKSAKFKHDWMFLQDTKSSSLGRSVRDEERIAVDGAFTVKVTNAAHAEVLEEARQSHFQKPQTLVMIATPNKSYPGGVISLIALVQAFQSGY